MELDMLVTLRKGLDTVLTMGFGIFWVPLFAAVVSPAAGAGVAVGLASSLAIAKRVISPANWRREHGWSLLVPGVGLWMTRRLAREDPTAAKVAARLSLIGAVGMLLLSTALNASSSAREGEKLRRAMQSEESTAAYLQGPPAATLWRRSNDRPSGHGSPPSSNSGSSGRGRPRSGNAGPNRSAPGQGRDRLSPPEASSAMTVSHRAGRPSSTPRETTSTGHRAERQEPDSET